MAKLIPGVNDLATVNPALAAQWHPTKNGELTPDMVTAYSHKKVWWLCSYGHKWNAKINRRSRECPYCSGICVTPGKNDLATINPTLAAEWHPTKNDDLKPDMVHANSNKSVWWLCQRRHEWEAIINDRNGGSGCPYCSGRLVIPGETDLATLNPTLAKEWHPTKNGDLAPDMVAPQSNQKAWWQCSKGHEWEAVISSRNSGRGCPYCAGNLVIVGTTDLATTNPELAAEWHPTKNNDLTPEMVTAYSHKKIWWQCDKGHEWEATIGNRSYGRSCPYCAGKKVWPGFNDLATTDPILATEWNHPKNGYLKPNMVTKCSGKKVWWTCSRGHEWESTIYTRHIGAGCPYCSGKVAIIGETDLVTVNPVLAAEWHPTKNGTLTPRMITASSNKNVWWRCERGHEWCALVESRSKGSCCPYCAGRTLYKKQFSSAWRDES